MLAKPVDATVDLWMAGRRYDVFFFQMSALPCLLLIIPYKIWGAASVLPIYNFYLIFFGMPHNFLTWAHMLPKNVRHTYNMDLIKVAAIGSFALCALVPLVQGTTVENWILSIITYASLWHAYRQHHGICKIYDAIQSQRSKDQTIFADRRVINIFLALALHVVLVWAFTHERIPFLLSADAMYELVYPRLPWTVFESYVILTCVVGIWGLKRCMWDRYKTNRQLPWPQLGIMFWAIATYVIPYIFIPLDAIPVSVAIGTIFHNVQYFAFVWLAERHRARELLKNDVHLNWWQRLANHKRWRSFLAISLVYSFVVIAVYLVMPIQVALVMIYFLALAHYVIDGVIWKSNHNKMLGATIKRLAFQS